MTTPAMIPVSPPSDTAGYHAMVVSAASAYDHFVEPTADGGVAVTWPSLDGDAHEILTLDEEGWAAVAAAAFGDDRLWQACHDTLWDALLYVLAERRCR
jgi:hypothetical protein